MDINDVKMNLFFDLYELTMMQSYFFEGENKIAVFDFFVRYRKWVPRRYFVFAGLEFLIDFVQNLRFSDEEIEYLKSLGLFRKEFLDYLRDFRFEGEIWSLEEGRIFFPYEPVIEVVAPLPQAQIIETAIINLVQFSILSATKAARIFSVAGDKMLIDFGARRAHSPQSAEISARSAYICGFMGTSLLSAGKKYGIPVYGTMAHSYIMIYDDEKEAFEKFTKLYNGTVLLVDTYDTKKGVKNAIEVITKLKEKGIKVRGIRIDSGDLAELSMWARDELDKAGLHDVFIFLSGGLNEYKIKELLDKNVKVDGFGVGTDLTVSSDLPYLDCAYKLVEYEGKPRMKLSAGKKTFPGRKNFKRLYKEDKMVADYVYPFGKDESFPKNVEFDSSEIMLKKVFGQNPSFVIPKDEREKKQYIIGCRDRFMRDFASLPDYLKSLDPPTEDNNYPVIFSEEINQIMHYFEKKYS
jgi:nicotinate phosphoribosyltransferase